MKLKQKPVRNFGRNVKGRKAWESQRYAMAISSTSGWTPAVEKAVLAAVDDKTRWCRYVE